MVLDGLIPSHCATKSSSSSSRPAAVAGISKNPAPVLRGYLESGGRIPNKPQQRIRPVGIWVVGAAMCARKRRPSTSAPLAARPIARWHAFKNHKENFAKRLLLGKKLSSHRCRRKLQGNPGHWKMEQIVLMTRISFLLYHRTQHAPHNLQTCCALRKLLKLRIQAGLLTRIN